jgi:hypothetical protein
MTKLGNYTLLAGYVNDTMGLYDSDIVNANILVSLFVDNIPPQLFINSPKNQTYYSSNLLINITATDYSLDKVWYNYNGTNITYSNPINVILPDSNYLMRAWANDSLGNINSTSTYFTIFNAIYNSVPYCSEGNSPCVAGSNLLKCRDNINDGNGPEPNNPNTIDSCTDGTAVYSTPSCGNDESVENITIISLNHSKFVKGDFINVSAWVHCYGTNNYVGLIYAPNASSPVWQVIEVNNDECLVSGYRDVIFSPFNISNISGDHAVRVYITYDTAPNLSQTCAVRSSGNRYDDNDDVVFKVFEEI